jgi:hypothetical protein
MTSATAPGFPAMTEMNLSAGAYDRIPRVSLGSSGGVVSPGDVADFARLVRETEPILGLRAHIPLFQISRLRDLSRALAINSRIAVR